MIVWGRKLIRTVQCCTVLYTVISTHIWAVLTVVLGSAAWFRYCIYHHHHHVACPYWSVAVSTTFRHRTVYIDIEKYSIDSYNYFGYPKLLTVCSIIWDIQNGFFRISEIESYFGYLKLLLMISNITISDIQNNYSGYLERWINVNSACHRSHAIRRIRS